MYHHRRTRSLRVAVSSVIGGALVVGTLAGPALASSDAASPVGQARKAGGAQIESMRKAGGEHIVAMRKAGGGQSDAGSVGVAQPVPPIIAI